MDIHKIHTCIHVYACTHTHNTYMYTHTHTHTHTHTQVDHEPSLSGIVQCKITYKLSIEGYNIGRGYRTLEYTVVSLSLCAQIFVVA